MSNYSILAWQPLLRPPLPNEEPPSLPDVPLKTLSCRNAVASVAALVTSDTPVASAKLRVSDLSAYNGVKIPASHIRVRLVGSVPTLEAGCVTDPLYDVDEFAVDKCAAFYVSIDIPSDAVPGLYKGNLTLVIDENEVAANIIEIEVMSATLPDATDWDFFLNVWMNPAPVARWHKVDMWSEEHFQKLRPYVADLAAHGQKSAVVPIAYQPWGTQTVDPYPSTVKWTKRGDNYEFDFSIFDRYVRLYEECGIDRAIHCYSIVQGPGETNRSIIAYTDADTKEEKLLETHVGDSEYIKAWSAFFVAFRNHLKENGWMEKTFIAFDEKPQGIMNKLSEFLREYASDFLVSLATNTGSDYNGKIDDMSLLVNFNESGIAQELPDERNAMGMKELMEPGLEHPNRPITTFYVCCSPDHPNTFTFSPLVESRMIGFLAMQGGYDGFLRWAYNDWSPEPYERPEYHPDGPTFPTGDTYFVYPGDNGPVSSLRWEQLREGIQDYELAMLASSNIQTPDEMVDYEQAIALACRNVDGRNKSVGDIELARRLLMPIAEHQVDGE